MTESTANVIGLVEGILWSINSYCSDCSSSGHWHTCCSSVLKFCQNVPASESSPSCTSRKQLTKLTQQVPNNNGYLFTVPASMNCSYDDSRVQTARIPTKFEWPQSYQSLNLRRPYSRPQADVVYPASRFVQQKHCTLDPVLTSSCLEVSPTFSYKKCNTFLRDAS